MMSRRPRPTAFEVSFPGEASTVTVTSAQSTRVNTHEGPLTANPQQSMSRMDRTAQFNNGASDGGRDGAKRKFSGIGALNTSVEKRPRVGQGLRYTPRDGEFIERENLVIVGEDDEDRDNQNKPMRTLTDFTIFDSKRALEVVSLNLLEHHDTRTERQLEAAGYVAPIMQNEEDAGQEDDMEDGVDEQQQRLRTTAILRYEMDYTQLDDPIWIETRFAWYMLRRPSQFYKESFMEFYRPQRIAQIVLSSVKEHPTWTYQNLRNEFVGQYDVLLQQIIEEQDLRNAKQHISSVLVDLPNGDQLARRPILRELLNGYTPALSRRNSAARPPVYPTSRPFWSNNIDITVLRPENQNLTHVTPLIGQLAHNLFSEDLEVVGPKPVDREQQRLQKRQRRTQLLQLLMSSTRRGEKKIVYPLRERHYQQYWKCVFIDEIKYSVGDVIMTPIGTYAGREMPVWPENLEELPESKTLSDFFWFAKIIYIDSQAKVFHIQWFEHSSQTILEDLGNPQELFLAENCSDLPCTLVSGKAIVHRVRPGDDTSRLGPLDFFYAYVYNDAEASFRDVNVTDVPRDSCNPPDICPVHLRAEELVQRNTAVQIPDGIAYHGDQYHVGDFVLVKSDRGPANIAQILAIEVSSKARDRGKTDFIVRMLGRMSDITHLSAMHMFKDERHLFISNEEMSVPLPRVVRKCHVVASDEIPNLQSWISRSPYHFYLKYRSQTLKPVRQNQLIPVENLTQCPTCTEDRERKESLFDEFLAIHKRSPLSAFDPFAGVGVFVRAMEGTGCLKMTHAVEISPSAAKTLRCNTPDAVVYNQCANVVLKYAVKKFAGHDVVRPKAIGNEDPLPDPPRPGDIDCIVSGFPCQSHSQLNQFHRADDRKSHLILNLLSWIDFLRPKYCFFENVRGFLGYSLNATQVRPDRVEGGIKMGGLKFVMKAMLAMGYQVRIGLLQAAHYGAPQARVRFFLVAAKSSYPLPSLPQPTHDFELKDALSFKPPLQQREVLPIRTESGVAPHPFVSIDDAISDLPQFDWELAQDARYRRKGYCGIRGSRVEYRTEPETSYQQKCRQRPTSDIQHINKVPKFETMERVLDIPLIPGADYRHLKGKHWEWQFSDPKSAVARGGFQAGLYGRLDGKKWFHTTVTNVDPTAKQSWVLHPHCRRILTVRELARSQGFPDWFVFHAINDDIKTMHRQIGNAVPWPVSEALGRELREALFEKWLRDRDDDAMVVD